MAFITLLERKILGYSQLRLGPTKPSFAGILQPVRDAIKLFTKNYFSGLNAIKSTFYLRPFLRIFLVLIIWSLNSFVRSRFSYEIRFFLIVIFLGLNVYPVMLRGWSSNRKYTFLGGVRGVAQSISYEISLAFILMSIIQLRYRLRFFSLGVRKNYYGIVMLSPILLGIWVLRALAERNRTPFDFAEGERELVSGFNTEYGAGGFAVIFMAEYGRIFFLSYIRIYIFFRLLYSHLFISILVSLVIFLWVWVRRTYPRYRYDMLINLAWKRLLPFSIFYVVICLVVCI